MNRRSFGVMCLLLGLAPLGGSLPASASDLPRDFANKYQAATVDYTQAYSHATVTGTLLREQPHERKQIEQQFVLRSSGNRLRLDVTTTAQENMNATIGKVMAYIATADGSLETWHGPGTTIFEDAKQLGFAATKAKIEALCPLMSPFKAVGQGTVLELLQMTNVRVASMERIERRGEILIKVTFEESDGPRSATHRSYFMLSPSEGWAVREYYRVTGNGESQLVRRGRIAYDGTYKDVALVKRIECWEEQGPKCKCTLHEVLVVSSFDTTEPSDYFFTAFAF
jgi:hypothetical protein